jgi:hypothetical protein
VNNEYPLEDLIITKTLKSSYVDPTKIAHKVLADRMALRDPGNKPQVNDRIPFVYIQTPPNVEVKLQGDRIEHPDFIRDNNLYPDYQFYITNQLLKPIVQLYALCVEQLPNYSYPPEYWYQIDEELKQKTIYTDDKKRAYRIQALREREVENLLFDSFIIRKTKKKACTSKAEETKKNKIPKHVVPETSPLLIFRIMEDKNEKKFIATCDFMDQEMKLDIQNKKITKTNACHTLLRNVLTKLFTEYKHKIETEGLRIQIEDTRFKNLLKKTIDEYDQIYEQIATAEKEGDIEKLETLQQMERNLIIAQLLHTIRWQIL